MKPGNYMVFAAILLSSISAYGDYCPDDEIKEALNYRTLPKCGNPHVRSAPRVTVTGWRYFDGDTNRLLRVMREFYADCTDFQKRILMDDFVSCGVDSLPFLYSCATNPVCGDCAIKSIIAIEGVTSNSTSLVERYLASDLAMSQKNSIPADLCAYFVKKAVEGTQDPVLTTNAIGVVHAFAMTRNQGHTWLDRNLVTADPSYRFSKRRLAVMRAVSVKTLNDFQANYVTNAINELVAYPEADLPD